MFNMAFGVPIILDDSTRIPEKQLRRMRKAMSEKLHLTNAYNIYTGDTHPHDIYESQILATREFKCLVDPILKLTRAYIKQLSSHHHEYQQFIMKSWPVVMKPGSYINNHTHSYAHLSIVFYLDAPEPDSGGCLTFIKDSNHPLEKVGMDKAQMDSPASGGQVEIPPRKNGIIIFPSAVPHFVSKYTGKKPRYSISCDLMNIKSSGSTEHCLLPPDKWIAS